MQNLKFVLSTLKQVISMNIYKKIEREKNINLLRVFLPLVIVFTVGYFLYEFIHAGLLVGWEVYFAMFCYISILITLIIVDLGIVRWIVYDIDIRDGKLRIKDSLFTRAIYIPLDRIYYISSMGTENDIGYDSIFITDKKITHSKIKPLAAGEFQTGHGHYSVINELKELYPDKKFYYYRVYHHGYKFLYYFYMIYKNCERCKFSDISMELVKSFVQQK
jgi:hypothetical protein